MIDMIVEKNQQFENDFTTITTLEQAIRAANELERLQAMVDHLKEELKKFVETNGSFSTDTKTYYIQETVTYKFPQENIYKIAQALTIEGKNAWDYLSITGSTLQKAGWDETAILQFGDKRISKTFKSKKR